MRRAFRVAAIVAAVLVLAVLSLPLLMDANQFRPALESRLSRALERQVTIGDLSLAVFSGGVAVRDVTVAAEPGTSLEPLLRATFLTAGVDLRELLFSRRLIVRSIAVEEPVIVLVDSPAGLARPASPEAGPAPPDTADRAPLNLSVQRIDISNGRISLSTASGARPIQLENVNLSLRDFAPDASFPFTLSTHVASGGDVRIEGRAGPVQARTLVDTPFEGTVQITGLDLAASGYFEPETGIGGLLSLNGNATSDGRNIETSGTVSVKQLKLARNGKPAAIPAELDFRVTHGISSRRGAVQGGKVRLGKAEAVLAGMYDISGRQPTANLKLTGSKMPLTELAAFLPALDVQLPAGANIERGTANVEITVQGPVNALITAASIRADQARLGNFDLSSRMKVLAELAGLTANPSTDIELLTANIRNTPEGTAVDGLKIVIPGIGELTGQGTVSPQHALNFRMVAKLQTSGAVRQLLGQNVPFLIQGTSADPSFRADLKAVSNQKIEQAIRNPKGAAKTVRNIIDLFKRAPKQEDKAEQK
jgi:AsmA protein